MSDHAQALGISFSGSNIYFAVGAVPNSGKLDHIGRVELTFPVLDAVLNDDQKNGLSQQIAKVIGRICRKYEISTIRALTYPQLECWSMLPKLAYDDPQEREAHLQFFLKGMDRKQVEVFWFDMSNHDFRFMGIRDRNVMSQFDVFTNDVADTEYCSDFEIGLQWVKHSGSKGSFMTIGCSPNTLAVGSYLLGKLRAATCLRFNHIDDLPYVWKQSEQHLKWMKGYHEEIVLYGHQTARVVEMLRPFWDGSAEPVQMDTLAGMGVDADESTYSFPLQEAFPAIMLAIKD